MIVLLWLIVLQRIRSMIGGDILNLWLHFVFVGCDLVMGGALSGKVDRGVRRVGLAVAACFAVLVQKSGEDYYADDEEDAFSMVSRILLWFWVKWEGRRTYNSKAPNPSIAQTKL
jgi:hypothetical protein